MIDKRKRQTLKGMAAMAGASAVASLPAIALSSSLTENTVTKSATSVRQVWPPIAMNSPITLSAEQSTANNDLQLTLTNKSNQPVTMTQLTPSSPHGNAAAKNVLRKGPRQLAAGESIGMSLQQAAKKTTSGPMRTGITLTTDANQFAAVSYAVLT